MRLSAPGPEPIVPSTNSRLKPPPTRSTPLSSTVLKAGGTDVLCACAGAAVRPQVAVVASRAQRAMARRGDILISLSLCRRRLPAAPAAAAASDEEVDRSGDRRG